MDYTEAGSGNTASRLEASLELHHALNRAASLRYYGGLRRSDLRMAGYTEDNAAFPHLCRRFLPPDHRLCRRHLLKPCRPS